MPTKRICLWSGPRNISTALMYSFAQRSDTAVVDEPLYAHYLSVSDATEYHPGAKKVLSSQENDGEKVIACMLENNIAPVIFYKHMAHHLEGLDLRFLESTVNIILTREPREMITSFAKVIPNPSLKDLGYEQQVELFEKLKSMEHVPIVLDSKKILLNPETTLRNLCNRLDIPFQPEMLRWKAGARKEDGVWAKHWYKNVHESVGFAPYTPKNDIISDDLKDVLDESESLYSRLIKNSI